MPKRQPKIPELGPNLKTFVTWLHRVATVRAEMKLLSETVLVSDALAMFWDSDVASLEFCPMA